MLKKHAIPFKDKDGKIKWKRVPFKFASPEVAKGAEHFPLHFEDEEFCKLWDNALNAKTDEEIEKAGKELDEYDKRKIKDWIEKHPYYPYK